MSKEVQVISGRMKQICGEEQKRILVEASYASGLSLNQFAKERGISPASLCQWRKKYPEGMRKEPKPEAECPNCDAMKKEMVKLKAYLGHKIFEFEGAQIA